jgi:hypothetical protein
MGTMRKTYKCWSENLEGSFGRPRHKYEDNIKREIRWEGVDWIDLAPDRTSGGLS